MSKLHDIFVEVYGDTVLQPLAAKMEQKIKDLILELAGPEATSNHFWQHEFNAGYNHCLKHINMEVEKL